MTRATGSKVHKQRMKTVEKYGYDAAMAGENRQANPYVRSDSRDAWERGYDKQVKATGILGGKKVTGKWITPMYPPVPVVDDEVNVEAALFGVESVVRMQLAKLLSHDLELAGDRLHELAHVLKLVGEYNGGDKGYGELFKSIVGMLNVKEE